MARKPVLRPLLSHPLVKQMQQYVQHGSISTYRHCLRVAALSHRLNRRLHLNADRKTLLTGALLHDFYLYDWHHKDGGAHDWHGFRHADTAADNAVRHFGADKRVEHVIRSHMWPLNLTRLPRSREAWIVCVADKWASLEETLFHR